MALANTQPLVAFRLDANSQIGCGHLSRCSAVAVALKAIGFNVVFLLGANKQKIDTPSINIELLEVSELGGDEDRLRTVERLSALNPICLVLDGYQFGEYYRQHMAETLPLVCFDDSNKSGQLYAKVVINALATADQLDYERTAPSAVYLLGDRYALLPKQFQQINQSELQCVEERKHLLVCFGGSDSKQITGSVLELLAKTENRLKLKGVEIDIVCGPLCREVAEIESMCLSSGFNFYFDCENIALLMSKAGLAIAAPGSMIYELAYMGVPTVFILVAENQRLSANHQQALSWCEVFENSDDADSCAVECSVERAVELWHEPERREIMSAVASKLYDNLGAERIAACLQEFNN